MSALKNVILDNAALTEVSPWLEMTRWLKYLQGHLFDDVALLASPADQAAEPLLVEFSDSLVEEAHSLIQNNKVNVFNQARINSFIQRRRAFDRPLMTKLRDSTNQNYQLVFKRLICFAYRTIQLRNRVALTHRWTTCQLGHLDQMIGVGQELADFKQSQKEGSGDDQGLRTIQKPMETWPDRACLRFCISILDHTLKGDLFESILISFCISDDRGTYSHKITNSKRRR